MLYHLEDFEWKTTRAGNEVTIGYYKHDPKDPEEKPIRLVYPGHCILQMTIDGFVKEVQFNGKMVKKFESKQKLIRTFDHLK